ncbi:3'(2'),5'-bisphosphate nucleotidase CysQ [Amnibacterium kyonggiense]|uniref:3'(2'),5-bisphosphonucleoside 3'(2')-phosphohydrolase n=1 Tax=Amnibacterium kyonggiense TaxID=595671 RepID=A0A4R7FPN2_9MICO|nr:3'(2'),5'-bisphosphate nucleotidase CysQ [Amnibacterium kyonggiense]TDS79712.1 3'(2'),5'-bisphosphate nucleotidase [Amnibacterium kyonggiense]
MTTDDTALAGELARSAVALLQELRAGSPLEGTALKDAGDAASERFLAERFRSARPGDAVLSEEAVDDPARLTADRVWIVDPLDGTREFSEGRDDWAVHVALWERGLGLTAGAVATPTGTRTTGDAAPGDAGLAEALDGLRRLRLAVSRSRPPALVGGLLNLLRAEAVPMGSAGVKTLAVVSGAADAYVHAGGQYEWDSAAPVAVARAAGLHTSRIDGSPLEYNRADPLLPDLVVCPPALADRLLGAIATVLEGEA